MDYDKILSELEVDEGKRQKAYLDTKGKVTVGVGRNLTDRGLSEDEIQYLLCNDVKMVEQQLNAKLPWWRQMNAARQNVLTNMCFNMGITTLLTFEHTLKAMEDGDYELAASEMLDSLWAKQVHARADRLAERMKTGEF